MKIIKATSEHIDEIVELNKLFHLDLSYFQWDTREYVSKHIEKYYILEEDKAILGAINIDILGREAYIETIAVSQTSHGKGIGKQLIEFAKKYARNKGAYKLNVESFCEYNIDKFYEKCGFEKNKDLGYFQNKPYFRFSMNL